MGSFFGGCHFYDASYFKLFGTTERGSQAHADLSTRLNRSDIY